MTDSAGVTGVPTTVVVDVQNVHGVGGHVLGTRRKPDPEGIARALRPLGFDVIGLDVPVGTPEENDLRHVIPRLSKQAERVTQLSSDASGVLSPSASGCMTQALRELEGANRALLGADHGAGHRERLEALNQAAESGRRYLSRACRQFLAARERLLEEANRHRAVAGQLALDIHELWDLDRRAQQINDAVEAISSYAWASRQNLAFESRLAALTGPPRINVRPGRFRPGFEEKGPDEKQIDTLCAVACLEHARRAVEAGRPHAVVLLSDDDDLSPALRSAAALVDGTEVTVVVAGSDAVRNRWQSMGPSPDRPRWVVLDQHAWHWIVGVDPVEAALQRHQLARLALGQRLPILPGADQGLGMTAQGLEVRVRGYTGELPAPLHLQELTWRVGRSSRSPVPTAIVGNNSPPASPGRTATCLPSRRTRLAIDRIPIDLPGYPRGTVHATVPAPGWWRAGHEVVVADATGSGAWRVVGPATPPPTDLGHAVRGVVDELTLRNGTWAVVRTRNGNILVLVDAGTALHVGEQVAVVPYDHPGSPGAVHRGLLVSSAL